MDLDFEKAILIVGSDERYKSNAAKALALQPEPVSKTLVGEIYARSLRDPGEAGSVEKTTPFLIDRSMRFGEIVVNTAPFPEEHGTDDAYDHMREIAALWISSNSLQELDGREMAVVCVINTILPYVSQRASISLALPSWLSLLRYIFDPAKVPITFLVFKPHGSMESEGKTIIQHDLKKQRFGDLSDVLLQYGALEDGAKLEIPTMKFLSHSQLVKLHGPWAPVKVILFGRTGSGKSTIAQMLIYGRLDPAAKTFAASSSARGKTVTVDVGVNWKWFVVDTPGLGETSDELATVHTETAVMKIYDDIRKIHGVFTHYIYVCKQARHDLLEEDTWNFFLRIFGEKIASNFTVVITNSTPEWIDEYIDRLRIQFKGCTHFLSVQFPPVDEDRDLEEENQIYRSESLRQFEEGLMKLKRKEVSGNYGRFSKMTVGSDVAHFRHFRNSKTSLTDRAAVTVTKKTISVVGAVVRLCPEILKETYAEKDRAQIFGHKSNLDYHRN